MLNTVLQLIILVMVIWLHWKTDLLRQELETGPDEDLEDYYEDDAPNEDLLSDAIRRLDGPLFPPIAVPDDEDSEEEREIWVV